MLAFDRFDALTFDCYGTLIDWERGLLDALAPVLRRHGVTIADDRLLTLFAAAESETEAGPYLPYRDVLGRVTGRIGAALGFAPDAQERGRLAATLPEWPAFPDTAEALGLLARRFRLGIVSNIDDDLFAGTAKHLGVTFAAVTTAQQVRSYKPAPTHFHRSLEKLGLPVGRVLHVAQSRFHDIAPARALGFATVWVNRRSGRPGSGATPEAGAAPDLEVPDLMTLARLAATGVAP
jgi:2-haloacid dehalogenase